MYYLDHNPPHFHVAYAGEEAKIRIGAFDVIAGNVPPRVLVLVTEWASIYEHSLLENWRRLRADLPPVAIPPLE